MSAGSLTRFTVLDGDVYVNIDQLIVEMRDNGADPDLIAYFTALRKIATLAYEHVAEMSEAK